MDGSNVNFKLSCQIYSLNYAIRLNFKKVFKDEICSMSTWVHGGLQGFKGKDILMLSDGQAAIKFFNFLQISSKLVFYSLRSLCVLSTWCAWNGYLDIVGSRDVRRQKGSHCLPGRAKPTWGSVIQLQIVRCENESGNFLARD